MAYDSHEDEAPAGEPRLPIIDLHCDLLSYLETAEGATPENTDDIGCALPYLRAGNVKIQILAAYVPTEPNAPQTAAAEFARFAGFPEMQPGVLFHVATAKEVEESLYARGTGVIAAIENASALCNESEPIELAFTRLDERLAQAGMVLYLTMTHHGENRFGGGNMTDIGLKSDGEVLLDRLSGTGIAIDFSHTSDALARDILDRIDSNGLDLPVLASHSNFRAVFEHARNVPDWLAREIAARGGVIGINFIRAFVHTEDSSYLERHVLHGLELGLGDALCFGADFFYWKATTDMGRIPFYHPEHEHAGKYQEVLDSFGPALGEGEKQALAYRNALEFLQRHLG